MTHPNGRMRGRASSIAGVTAVAGAVAGALAAPSSALADPLRCGGFDLARTVTSATVVDNDTIFDNPVPRGYNKAQANTGIRRSITEINNRTAFTFNYSTRASTSVDQWQGTNLASINAVGVALINGQALSGTLDCSRVSQGRINIARYFYNNAHPFEDQDDYTCTAIHEFLHGLGLAHNSDVGSVMRVQSGFTHNNRCHGASPAIRLSNVDVADIDALYK